MLIEDALMFHTMIPSVRHAGCMPQGPRNVNEDNFAAKGQSGSGRQRSFPGLHSQWAPKCWNGFTAVKAITHPGSVTDRAFRFEITPADKTLLHSRPL